MVEIGPRLKRILRKAGYEYYRQAKGDHEIWRHPQTQKQVARCRHEVPAHRQRNPEAGRSAESLLNAQTAPQSLSPVAARHRG